MSRIDERRALVEMRMVQEGEGFDQSALAREFGVSRRTVARDVAAVRARWAALSKAEGEDLLAERTRTAAFLEAVAMRALARYARLDEAGSEGAVAVGYLNAAIRAMGERARLMGLDAVKPENVGPRTIRILPPEGYPDIRPPVPPRSAWGDLKAARLASGEDTLDDYT